MKRTIIGGVIATVAMYLWGFAYWGASPIPYTAWNETADDRAAGAALLEHFPESGVYYLPANGNPPELRSELYDAGPTGFVILDVDGRPEFDPGIMVQGFILNGISVGVLALLMHVALGSLPSYRSRLTFAALAGAFAVVFINFGDAVWWALPWNWELMQAFYNFSAIVIGGAILAAFITPESARTP